jgi:hypothetical protein
MIFLSPANGRHATVDQKTRKRAAARELISGQINDHSAALNPRMAVRHG